MGQYFPFWVNHQSVLHLKVASMEPADLVKLGIGLELAVAPRPRMRAQLLGSSQEAGEASAPKAQDVAWLRMQVLPYLLAFLSASSGVRECHHAAFCALFMAQDIS